MTVGNAMTGPYKMMPMLAELPATEKSSDVAPITPARTGEDGADTVVSIPLIPFAMTTKVKTAPTSLLVGLNVKDVAPGIG